MHEIALEPIEWRDVKDLFGPHLERFQAASHARLLRAQVDEVGFAVHWMIAPRGKYLFFAPRYKHGIWTHLEQWYRSFFLSERVKAVKQFAKSRKWSYRKLPVLDGLTESLADFGVDFDGWNQLIAVEEYVLPAERSATDQLLNYLRDWEGTFAAHVYRDESLSSHTAKETALMSALQTNPLVVQGATSRGEVKRASTLLLEVLDRWSVEEALINLSTQDTFPVIQRDDLVPSMPLSESATKDWHALYELRVAFLEKFSFPWFYRPALAMLGAEGPKHSLTASQLVEQGLRPPSQPICPKAHQERIGQVALKLEKAFPILAQEPSIG